MTALTADSLGSFGRLAIAIGLVDAATGAPNLAWFTDPLGATGGAGNQHGLRHLLADDDQRTALLDFVDEVLGPPENTAEDTQTWVPLFGEDDPHLTVYAVVAAVSGQVHLGIGLDHATAGGPPSVATRLHVPLFRFARRGAAALTPNGSLPSWLLLGSPGARVEITIDGTFDDSTPAPGEAALAGVAIALGVPTNAGDDLTVSFTLAGLQLPGAQAPSTFEVGAASLAELGTDVLDLVLGLVQAQADALSGIDPALEAFRALTGLVGLRDVPGLPPLPLADLPAQGVAALVGWIEQVLADGTARDAWLGQLALLVGGDLEPDLDAVSFTAGGLTVLVGVRVEQAAAGHPVLVPWVDVGLATRTGARVAIAADILSADTGTGAVRALPSARLEAVFGVDAGGPPLLTGPAPRVGSLHAGVVLDATGRPAFTLTLHDVVATTGGTTHAVLDISSPSAALDSAEAVVLAALADAIAQLGAAGPLVSRLLGIEPPATVDPVDVTLLLSDPVAAVRAYWRGLTGSAPATADTLGRLRALLTGVAVAPVAGNGTAAAPWTIAFASTVDAAFWRESDILAVDLRAAVSTPVLTDYAATATLGIAVLRTDLVTGSTTFAQNAGGALALARQDGGTARLTLGPVTIEADRLAVRGSWTAATGFGAGVEADGLAVAVPGHDPIAVTLPTVGPDGALTLPAPDWVAIERVLAGLLAEARLPALDALLELIGWGGAAPGAAHLPLAGLVGGDPAAAVADWLADLVLDCDHVVLALRPMAALLNGLRRNVVVGSGTVRSPYRCTVAGEPLAPGIAVWLDPGCSPPPVDPTSSPQVAIGAEAPDTGTMVALLRDAGLTLPDVADLMVGRDSLAGGFDLLLGRWTGTDGLVGRPAVMPDDVAAVELAGLSYAELVAMGSVDLLLASVLDEEPTAIVHVGTEPTWSAGRPPGTVFDCTGPDAPGTLPATGSGTWYVRLPSPQAAATARPERGAVGEQAARLAAVLAGRTGNIVVLGYGSCGAAAIRAAATVIAVSEVVTVGTPWSGLSVDSLATGLGGDALRLLARLGRSDALAWPDAMLAQKANPHQQVYGIIANSLAILTPGAELPSAGEETRRAGLTVSAVFGAMGTDTLAAGLGAYLGDGVDARREAAYDAEPGEITALHAGADLPVIDLDLGGLLVGVGARLELCRIGRDGGGGIEASTVRGVLVSVHLGVHDGWLVGGPGSGSDVGEARWMSAHVDVPLDGRPGDAEFVLHEARGFGVDRERWVVRADPAGAAPDVTVDEITGAVPEARVLLSDAIVRLRTASADLATLLDLLGLTRDGGLDPDGLDRLLHDAATAMRDAVAAAPGEFAAALRALTAAATGSAAALSWSVGPATVAVDLAAGALTASLRVDEPGVPPIEVDVSAGPDGTSATAAIGTLDPFAGGLRLVAGPGATVALDWAAPGAPAQRVPLLPAPDAAAVRDLATVALPAVVGCSVLTFLRQSAAGPGIAALDAALDAVGLLTPADAGGHRAVPVPIGLVRDPAGWLRHATLPWRTDLAGQAVALLDALAPLVAPDRGTLAGWPLAAGVVVGYGVEAGNRLRLVLDVTLRADLDPGTTVVTHLVGGLLIGPDALPQPTVEVSGDVGGRGLRLSVAAGVDPPVRLTLLRPAPATPTTLYPAGPGLGEALSAAGEMVLPPVLNAIAGHRGDAGASLVKSVGQAVYDLGGALDLRDGDAFTSARLADFAADPAGRLTARLPHLIANAAGTLGDALDPGHAIVEVTPGPDRVTFGFGGGRTVSLVLDASGPLPAIEVRADLELAGVGRLVLERLRLSAAGVEVAARLGPAPLELGPFALLPLVVVRAGSAVGTGGRTIGLGLALDAAAAQSVEVRWSLDANPPALVAIHRSTTGETAGTEAEATAWLLAIALSLAGGVAVDALEPVFTDNATRGLQGVVFTDVALSTQIDPGLALDLLDPARLFERLQRLLWNVAGLGLSVTIGGTATIALASTGTTTRQLGVTLTLPPGRRLTLADGTTRVELEVDATWVAPPVPGGLSIYVLSGSSPTTLELAPAVSIAGVGLRFSNLSGPLISLGSVSLDGLAVQVYGEAAPAGIGGGVNLELTGLAFAPGGGGGSNGVANSIMNDAGTAGPASRPALSPSFAVQAHPGGSPAVSLRAGPPPGPWFVVIQRQLGPLYLERVGLETTESGGQLSRVTLLFDGRVSIFGLTAAVDQLSISWTGGDLLDLDSWVVDLMGLAISADLSGVSLVGGILKTGGPPTIEPVSYVGMLLGRFGIYGLSVFGGYTDDNGSPSFFVFGAVNGPIGGPPAFFVTGIGGGLGINRGLVIPTDVANFDEFPFIQALDPAAAPPADPMAELRRLNVYFPPQSGNFWFAAGISFTSFALVDGIAVIAVSFGQGLEVNLLGLARMALPRPEAALVSIELGLLARFSTTEGLLLISAALTSNSWLLYPEVRLTGGFAYAMWWLGPLAGQFVITMGGYHPDFHRDGYPDVPRLGLEWRVTDDIVIKGGSYFALTSEALMAGVDVEVSADFGWAWARIAFGAHGIIYFDPFWYEVTVYARISAGVKIKTFLGTISFSISIGASVTVWGPEFSGRAKFEVGPCDITVPFGSQSTVEPRTLDWAEFVAKYLEDAGGGRARAVSAITGRGTLPAATGGDRSAPTSDGTAGRPFEVFAEFELTVVTTVPTRTFDLELTSGPVTVPVVRSDGMGAALGLKPMRAGDLSSTLQIRLTQHNPVTNGWEPRTAQLRLLAANLTAAAPRPEGSVLGTDAFPIGAWGQPDAAGLPAPPVPKGDVVRAGNLVRLVAEATLLAVGPEIDYYRVEASRRPLPLQAGGPSRTDLLDAAGTVDLPDVSSVGGALAAAQTQLFAAPVADPPTGLLASGGRSVLARAAYTGDVVAPPLFGTLADGMAALNAADPTAGRTPPAPPPPPGTPRTPLLAGFLTAGNRVAPRPGRTTVADRAVKRRVAPTLDSVQARLGRHLPIRMLTASAPSLPVGGTVAAGLVPRTVAVGASRSYALGTSGTERIVGGLGRTGEPRAAADSTDDGRPLAAGEVVLLTMPDASVDVAASRPSVTVTDGIARVTALRGDGSVAMDGEVRARVPVPAGTAVLAIQPGETGGGAGDGLAGWHARTRLCTLGSHAALGPGCVLTSEGAPALRGSRWTTATDLLAYASAVRTRFSRPVHTVAIVVAAAGADRLRGLGLELTGARRAKDAEGGDAKPTVLLSGDEAVLLYAVDPVPGAAVAVRVRAGGDWKVTGVLGGDLGVEALSQDIARRGVLAAAARVLATREPEGGRQGCRISWQDPAGSPEGGPAAEGEADR